MFSIKGTLYEKYPFLMFTPLGMFDMAMGTMMSSIADGTFLFLSTLVPAKGMGDFVPPQTK